MNTKAAAHRLCLLLSWQELLAHTAQKEAFAGPHYRRFVGQAIATLRAEASDSIAEMGSELQERIAAGEDQETLDTLRHGIKQINHLLKAKEARELGGPVAMTLEGFADTFEAKPTTTFGFTPLERQDFLIIVVSTFLIAISCFALTWYYLWRVDITFELDRADNNHLVLHLQNDGPRAATFLGSWPEVLPESDNTLFGVAVFCQANDRDQFQALESTSEIWIFQNEVMSPLRKINIEPGAAISVVLNLQTLEKIYGSPISAVRLECGSSGDRRSVVFTEPVSPSSP